VALSGAWQLIVVDLKDVAFLDLAGADPLVDAARRSKVTGQQVVLVHPQPRVARLLSAAGLLACVAAAENLPEIGELAEVLDGGPRRRR
jgi:anti-anti-sigma factor